MLPLYYPVGQSVLRVTCGRKAAFACSKGGVHWRMENYRYAPGVNFIFTVRSSKPEPFDATLSFPFVDLADRPVSLTRGGKTRTLLAAGADLVRSPDAPSYVSIHRACQRAIWIAVGRTVNTLSPGGGRGQGEGEEKMGLHGLSPLTPNPSPGRGEGSTPGATAGSSRPCIAHRWTSHPWHPRRSAPSAKFNCRSMSRCRAIGTTSAPCRALAGATLGPGECHSLAHCPREHRSAGHRPEMQPARSMPRLRACTSSSAEIQGRRVTVGAEGRPGMPILPIIAAMYPGFGRTGLAIVASLFPSQSIHVPGSRKSDACDWQTGHVAIAPRDAYLLAATELLDKGQQQHIAEILQRGNDQVANRIGERGEDRELQCGHASACRPAASPFSPARS